MANGNHWLALFCYQKSTGKLNPFLSKNILDLDKVQLDEMCRAAGSIVSCCCLSTGLKSSLTKLIEPMALAGQHRNLGETTNIVAMDFNPLDVETTNTYRNGKYVSSSLYPSSFCSQI